MTEEKKRSRIDFRRIFQGLGGVAGKLLVIAIIGYFIFLIVRSARENYQTSQKIKRLKQEIADIETKKTALQNLNIYYKTQTFKELEARRKLLLKKPGETVLPVEVKDEDLEGMDVSNVALPSSAAEPAPASVPAASNAELWWDYLTKS